MEAAWPHGGLWGLALLPPTLLLAALCARCRRLRGPPLESSEYKAPPSSFMVIGTPTCPAPPLPHPQPPLPPWGVPMERETGSPLPPPPHRLSAAPQEPDDDYTNEPFATGYVEVLPDQEGPEKEGEGATAPPPTPGGSSGPPLEEYENVPEGARSSLGDSLEYINLPPPGSTPGSENEDGPDYENLGPGAAVAPPPPAIY